MLIRFLLLSVLSLSLTSCQSTSEKFEAKEFIATSQDNFISKNEKPELIWSKGIFTEGPTVGPDGTVYFTDIPASRIMKNSKKGINIFRQDSGKANGLAFNTKKEMLICEGGNRQVTKLSLQGEYTVLASNYKGKKFNSPNDIVSASNGDIYFTDPRYGNRDNMELDYEGVFLIRNGELKLATKSLNRPNGILISIDGKSAYVADNNPDAPRTLSKFKIEADGSFSQKEILFKFQGKSRGIDGMDIDTEGNLYATAGSGDESGIYVFSPSGENLAMIPLPDKPTNCCFGIGKESNILYVTCQVNRQPHKNKQFGLFKIKLNKNGYKLK